MDKSPYHSDIHSYHCFLRSFVLFGGYLISSRQFYGWNPVPASSRPRWNVLDDCLSNVGYAIGQILAGQRACSAHDSD